MERSIPALVISMVLGIIISYNYIFSSIYIFLISILVLMVLISIRLFTGNRNSYILIIFYLLGIFIMLINSKSQLNIFKGKEVEIYGKIDSLKNKDNYNFAIEKIKSDDKTYNVAEKINLKYYGEEKFNLGESLIISTRLEDPMINTNPKLFNSKKFLNSKKIHMKANFKSKDIIRKIDESIDFKYRIREGFKNFVVVTMNKYLSSSKADLITGIILGDYSHMDEESINDYRELGLAHILAVSGLHIGIISSFLLFVLSNLGLERKFTLPLVMLSIWIYGFLIEFPISIVRANIIICISYFAKLLHEPEDRLNSIFISMFILIIINPSSIFDLSFQLSYGAVLSIVIIAPKLKELFYPWNNKLIDSISIILSVQIGLLPIQIYYFNYISIIGMVANLLIVPIVSIGLMFATSILLIEMIFSPINIILGFILNNLMGIEEFIFKWVKQFKYLNINSFSPDVIEILGYYILVFIIIYMNEIRKMDKRLINFLASISLISTILIIGDFIYDGKVEIHFIDVGQGDSILIKDKFNSYLVDTGGEVFGDFSVGKNITVPYLEKNNIYSLKGVFISHFHEDHSKGIIDVLENLKVENIFISYENKNSEIYKKIINSGIKTTILSAKDSFSLGDETKVNILSPEINFVDRRYSENDLSMVMYINVNGRKLLLTGDMEEKIESYIMDQYRLKNIDFLKVPHHGSKTSSTERLLDELEPKNAIFMAGRNNNFGHPNEEVLARYKDINSKIYRTDMDGRILIEIDGNGDYNIEKYLFREKIQDKDLYLYIISYIISILMIFYEGGGLENKMGKAKKKLKRRNSIENAGSLRVI